MSESRYTLSDLEALGFPVRQLTVDQQDVLRGLSDDELALLTDIRARLAEVGPDTQAHNDVAGAALF